MEHIRSMSVTTVASSVIEQEEEQPVRCAKFRRQEMWAFKPVWSPMVVAIMYMIVAVLLLPIGVAIYINSAKLMQTKFLRYDNPQQCLAEQRIETTALLNGTAPPSTCIIEVKIPRKTTGNVFLYYGVTNFYQNARRYATSRSIDQLRGVNKPNTDACEPDQVNKTNETPCGLTAFSRFNDSFTLCSDSASCATTALNVSSSNISWSVDRNELFKSNQENSEEVNQLITSEDFMVWMRLAPYRTWFKLSQRILEPLENTTYYMRIESNYPTANFSGQKFVYLAETTWFGGPNIFLGLACMIVGGASLLLSITYGIGSRNAKPPPIPPETTIEFWVDGTTEPSKNSPVPSHEDTSRG